MLSETMKTLPASGSLNSEINDYEHNDSRPIFAEMVVELKRLVTNKTNEHRMLPLECQYLNKPALTSLVGNQPAPMRHFVLKRKPKSTIFRAELMQKSADLQSSLKKISAPTVPLRSRGLPRKMTDTTPMKGIPSRVPSSGGFKTPQPALKGGTPVLNRGRKDGGVKFLEIEDQPLGYAAAKKRKRQQELEEQQKRAAENEQNAKDAAANAPTPTTTPDYAAGLAPAVYSQPATPMPSADSAPSPFTTTTTQTLTTSTTASLIEAIPSVAEKKATKKNASSANLLSPKRMKFEDDIEEVKEPVKGLPVKEKATKETTKLVKVTRTLPTAKSVVLTSPTQTTTQNIGSSYVTIKAVSAPNSNQSLSHLNIPSNTIVRTVQYVTTQAQQSGTSTNVVTTKSPTLVSSKPTIITKTSAAGKPTILSNIVLTPNMRQNVPSTASSTGNTSYVITSPNSKIVQRVMVSTGQSINLPTLTTRTAQPTIIQPMQQGQKIVQIKTTPTMVVGHNQNAVQNIPPLISTQQSQLLNMQNPQRKTVTLTSQQPNMGAQTAQQQKVNQIIVPSGVSVKGKTFIVSNQNQNQNLNLGQRNVILQSVGPGGNPVYQQIPLTGNVLRSLADQNQQKSNNQLPALVPTSNLSQNIPGLVIANAGNTSNQQPRLITNIATLQQQQTSSNVQIRPVLTSGGQLTLIQRPGQQAQLVQSAQIVQQPQTIQKTIITRPQIVQQVQQRQQTNLTTPQTSTSGTTIKVAATQNANSGQRRGLSLSVSSFATLLGTLLCSNKKSCFFARDFFFFFSPQPGEL